MKAKVEQNLAYIREQRAKSDAQDADMDIAGLKSMYKIWSDLVNEHKNDQAMQVYCASQLEAYETKIAQREKEHAAWLKNMSKPKNSPETLSSKTSSTSAPGAPHRPAAPRFTNAAPNNPTPPSILCQRADERKRAEAQRMEQLNNRAQARAEDKARKDAAKQAHLDAKAAAIRAEKEKQKHKADEQARQAAECIANARAKVYVAPKGNAGDSTLPSAQAQDGERVYKSAAKKLCGKCGAEHPSFAEWRKCNLRGTSDQQAKVENEEVDEGVFFHVV
ncbi:hypothetical protein K458DRAFT_421658 [Lentithecium fluviatile CBS 122367]|uniref:Uncharacterized protein n=1 Tax=Lentithecium fluviatile CBS 122367 TaxID=1168545 RepID=A0A6G1IQ58_9PLEO|nr:hypothetical protein K458DRAFT_421658 [Lentithecium fluviatile CBS 122367]